MASANDMKAANKTYDGFINALKWAVPALVVITALVVIAIGN